MAAYKFSSTTTRHLICLATLLSLIAFMSGCALSGCTTNQVPLTAEPTTHMDTVPSDTAATEDMLKPALPSKLKGSTETVDENGIVHGITPDGIAYTVHGRDVAAAQKDRVTLAAVGDQIASDDSLFIADRNAGDIGDGVYDFSPWFYEIGPFIAQSDLRYINQETVMAGGPDGYPISGYPSFNSPDCMVDSILSVPFNMVNFATNHTYDMGTFGVERSHSIFDQHPELVVAGSYLTQQDRETVQMIERNGITFAFLAFTYGDNNYMDPAAMPNTYYSCVFDEGAIEQDVKRAQEVADVVIVSMHWGSEYTTQVNDHQRYWSQFVADLDVDLIIGTHAHCMQPVEYVTSASGKRVPCVFGLSDIVSGWTITDTILSGIFRCDFVPQEDGTITVENLMWHPTIEWSDGSHDVWVRMLENMSDAEINANTRTPDVGNDADYLYDMVTSTIVEIPIAWQR